MDKKYVAIMYALIIVVFVVGAGLIIHKGINPAALSVPYLTHTLCYNQKCIVASGTGVGQCSTDNDCQTHMQCNNLKQCVSVAGKGTDKCSTDDDCGYYAKDPQQWCQTNNPGVESAAIKYPGGNFSCECYYDVAGIISQTPCTNSHSE